MISMKFWASSLLRILWFNSIWAEKWIERDLKWENCVIISANLKDLLPLDRSTFNSSLVEIQHWEILISPQITIPGVFESWAVHFWNYCLPSQWVLSSVPDTVHNLEIMRSNLTLPWLVIITNLGNTVIKRTAVASYRPAWPPWCSWGSGRRSGLQHMQQSHS